MLTVGENLRLGAAARSDAGAVSEDRERLLELFPILRERIGQQAGTLSGGEQQMLALARALMSRPRLLMLDEPSLGLAPLVVKSIFRTLGELKRLGTTMLLVEQNMAEALDLADRAYVLRTGEVTLMGQARALRADVEGVASAYLGARS
jgi:branched-chain amino acid transport system ATP-binding protein